jgi:hypothetical protein
VYRGENPDIPGEIRIGVQAYVHAARDFDHGYPGAEPIWREYISDGRGLVWVRNRKDIPEWAEELTPWGAEA